ncbi:MAG TPA: HAMP domain-containing sensor histidine kinase [Chryseolinea sp.]|nr:HAMP domain-containing sensor histidine kinase [Chryseolinea sp.]
MRNPLKKITIVFILVALLPVSFIVYELSSLNKNEKIIREIYQNQLDAILYSVNQYSDDVISSWANRFGIALADEKNREDSLSGIESVLNQLNAIQYLYFSDLADESVMYSVAIEDGRADNAQAMLDSIVRGNTTRINQLINYKKSGFQKMELLDTIHTEKIVSVFFILNEGAGKFSLGVMGLDLGKFIQNTLGPKMQAIAQERFTIAAFHENTDSLVYSTASSMPPQELNRLEVGDLANDGSQKKSFWLLPGYYLSISLKGATINDLVRDRVRTTTGILILLIIILAFGIAFLYRNIRREIHLAQAKSEFVSNVSHEIRTPLSLISMYAETLEMNRVSEEKKKEYHSVIAKETARLSRTVNRILNFSQIQASKKTYEARPIQLNNLVAGVLQSYHFHLNDNGFVCEFIKYDNLKIIFGDQESITEAFINLLDNAIKYSRDKKQLTIKTGVDDRYSFIEVKDEGIGIEKKYQQEIFDQFFRAPAGDVHNTKGSGLGLTLVKKTMDAHRGKIKVESVPGNGSTFRLYFPLEIPNAHES